MGKGAGGLPMAAFRFKFLQGQWSSLNGYFLIRFLFHSSLFWLWFHFLPWSEERDRALKGFSPKCWSWELRKRDPWNYDRWIFSGDFVHADLLRVIVAAIFWAVWELGFSDLCFRLSFSFLGVSLFKDCGFEDGFFALKKIKQNEGDAEFSVLGFDAGLRIGGLCALMNLILIG